MAASQSKVRDVVITGISTKFPDRNLPQYALGDSPYTLSTQAQSRSNTNGSIYPGAFSSSQSGGCFFDPHCPECIRELWGPLLSPFAYLIKQNAQYFNEILARVGQYGKHDATSNDQSSPRLPKLEYDDHKLLASYGPSVYRIAQVTWLITWTLGFLILMFAIMIIVLPNSTHPPLVVIFRMNEASKWGMKFTLQIVAIALSLIGIGKMLAAALGLFATVHRTAKLLTGTCIFIGVLIFLEVIAVVFCVVTWSSIVQGAEQTLNYTLRNRYTNVNNDPITNAWDRIFQSFECCSWSLWHPTFAGLLPYSCCQPGRVPRFRKIAPATLSVVFRLGASHPACENAIPAPGQNYYNIDCKSAIHQWISSKSLIPITLGTIALVVIVELLSAIMTFIYSRALGTAQRRRRQYNQRLIRKFKDRLAKYIQDASGNNPIGDINATLAPQEQTEVNDLRQLYNQYSAFHAPDIDPSWMSLTPTVVQVKRPNVYSYFYYE